MRTFDPQQTIVSPQETLPHGIEDAHHITTLRARGAIRTWYHALYVTGEDTFVVYDYTLDPLAGTVGWLEGEMDGTTLASKHMEFKDALDALDNPYTREAS